MITTPLAAFSSLLALLGPVAVTLAIAATALWGLAFLITRLLRGASAALRHQVWWTATLAVLLAPLLLPTIQRRLPRLAERPPVTAAPTAPVVSPTAAPVPLLTEPAGHERARTETLPAAKTFPSSNPSSLPPTVPPVATPPTRSFLSTPAIASISWRGLFVCLWGAGVVLQLVVLLRARLQVRALLRRARDLGPERIGLPVSRLLASLRLAGRVRFFESSETPVPFVAGIVRPAVVLPAEARDWSPARLEAVLLHELLHVRRRDLLTQSLARLAVALTWFHPLAWLALRRLRAEAEHATDDAVLTTGGCSPVDYAEHFLAIARQLARAARPLPATMSMAGRSSVEVRLRSILDRTTNRRPVHPAQLGLLLPGALAALAATAWVAPSRAEPAAAGQTGKTSTEPPARPAEAKGTPSEVKDSSAPDSTPDPTPNPGDATIQEALQALDRLDLKEPQPLREVIAQLAWKHRIPVRLEELGFNQSDCGSQTLVPPVSLEEAPLRSLLTRILESHLKRAGEEFSPKLLIRDGTLGISAGEGLRSIHSRNAYPEMSRVTPVRGTIRHADGTPAPRARLEAWSLGASTFATANDQGEFAIPILAGDRRRLLVFAQGEGATVAMASLPDLTDAQKDERIELVLEPFTEKEAKVVNAKGEPVADTRVELIVSGRPLVGRTTDGSGRLRMRFPAALPIEGILFWKRGAGFDYRRFDAEPYNSRPAVRTFGQLAGELESTLVGAERTTFVLTDQKGQPLPGIRVRPASVQFASEAGGLRLPELGELGEVTNAAGEVTFDWLPHVPSSITRFYHTSDRHARRIIQELGGDELERRETIPLVSKVRVSGHVRTADGSAVPGARVSGQASARNMFMGFSPTVADREGAFSLYLDPGCQAMLLAHSPDGRLVSPARDDLITSEGVDLDHVDFVLQQGTRLFGQLQAPEGTPASKVGYVSLILTGRSLKELPGVDLESIPGAAEFPRVQVNLLQQPGDDLTFEWIVGPGRYSASPPKDFRHTAGNGQITVTDEKEIRVDFRHEKWILAPPLRGTIVAGEGRDPVPEARLRMLSRQSNIAVSSAVADKSGRFEIQRESDPMVITVFSPDRTLGTVRKLDSRLTDVTIPLSPTAAIRLRVVDDQGKPFTEKVVVRADLDVFQKAPWNPEPPVPVKKDGSLEMSGLVVGTKYQLHVSLDGGETFHLLTSVTPENVGPIDIGELRLEKLVQPASPKLSEAGRPQEKDEAKGEAPAADVPRYLWGLSFSSDSRRIATCGDRLRIHEIPSGKRLDAIDAPWNRFGTIREVAFSPTDPELLAIGPDRGPVRLLRLGNADPVLTFDAPGPADMTTSLAFSRDGRFLAASSVQYVTGKAAFGKLRCWSVADGREVYAEDRDTAGFDALSFSADGSQLALCSEANLEVFQTTDWSQIGSVKLPPGNLGGSPFGLETAFAGEDRIVLVSGGVCVPGGNGCDPTGLLWRVDLHGSATLEGAPRPSYCRSVATTPDGTRFVTGHTAQGGFDVTMFDTRTSEGVWTVDRHAVRETPHEPYGVRVSPDGQFVAWCGERIYLVKASDGTHVRTIPEPE